MLKNKFLRTYHTTAGSGHSRGIMVSSRRSKYIHASFEYHKTIIVDIPMGLFDSEDVREHLAAVFGEGGGHVCPLLRSLF